LKVNQEIIMVEKPDPQAHEKARDLVEAALGKYSADKPGDAEKLIEQAQAIDPTAAQEVVADLDEDAGSNHTPDAG
jgi:hypothetical protein